MKPAPQTEGCLLKPPRIHRPVEITSHSSNHAKGMGIRATASATHQWPSTLRMNHIDFRRSVFAGHRNIICLPPKRSLTAASKHFKSEAARMVPGQAYSSRVSPSNCAPRLDRPVAWAWLPTRLKRSG
jgi:hypothetical protein